MADNNYDPHTYDTSGYEASKQAVRESRETYKTPKGGFDFNAPATAYQEPPVQSNLFKRLWSRIAGPGNEDFNNDIPAGDQILRYTANGHWDGHVEQIQPTVQALGAQATPTESKPEAAPVQEPVSEKGAEAAVKASTPVPPPLEMSEVTTGKPVSQAPAMPAPEVPSAPAPKVPSMPAPEVPSAPTEEKKADDFPTPSNLKPEVLDFSAGYKPDAGAIKKLKESMKESTFVNIFDAAFQAKSPDDMLLNMLIAAAFYPLNKVAYVMERSHMEKVAKERYQLAKASEHDNIVRAAKGLSSDNDFPYVFQDFLQVGGNMSNLMDNLKKTEPDLYNRLTHDLAPDEEGKFSKQQMEEFRKRVIENRFIERFGRTMFKPELKDYVRLSKTITEKVDVSTNPEVAAMRNQDKAEPTTPPAPTLMMDTGDYTVTPSSELKGPLPNIRIDAPVQDAPKTPEKEAAQSLMTDTGPYTVNEEALQASPSFEAHVAAPSIEKKPDEVEIPTLVSEVKVMDEKDKGNYIDAEVIESPSASTEPKANIHPTVTQMPPSDIVMEPKPVEAPYVPSSPEKMSQSVEAAKAAEAVKTEPKKEETQTTPHKVGGLQEKMAALSQMGSTEGFKIEGQSYNTAFAALKERQAQVSSNRQALNEAIKGTGGIQINPAQTLHLSQQHQQSS